MMLYPMRVYSSVVIPLSFTLVSPPKGNGNVLTRYWVYTDVFPCAFPTFGPGRGLLSNPFLPSPPIRFGTAMAGTYALMGRNPRRVGWNRRGVFSRGAIGFPRTGCTPRAATT